MQTSTSKFSFLFVLWDNLAKIKSYFALTNNYSYLFFMYHKIIKNFSFYSIPLRNGGGMVAQARNHKIPNFPFNAFQLVSPKKRQLTPSHMLSHKQVFSTGTYQWMKAKFVDFVDDHKKLLIALCQTQDSLLSGFLQGSELGPVSGSVSISNLQNWTEDTLKSAGHQKPTLQVCWITGLELKIIQSNQRSGQKNNGTLVRGKCNFLYFV